jgi:hypothetical protein
VSDSATSPVLPDYRGANVCGVVPGILANAAGRRPVWFPEPLQQARQVVLLLIDGLGWNQLQQHRHLCPTLAAMQGGPITTVAPTTTATALTSVTTGLSPAEHGVVGYRIDLGGDVVNTLRWATAKGEVRRQHVPREVQPVPPFLGSSVPVVSKVELEASAFSEAHLRGSRMVGWRTVSGLAVEVGRQLRAGEPFVYAYYDGVDKVAHERGFGPFYEAELVAADRLVGDVLAQLVPGAALAVIADHGQVQVGDNVLTPDDRVLSMVHHQSGEGRFRWLHARSGAAGDLLAAATEAHGQVAWVRSRQQILDEGWFGSTMSPPVAGRLGDVALVAHQPVSFDEPADTGPFRLICRHGSMTADEVLVPLLAQMED